MKQHYDYSKMNSGFVPRGNDQKNKLKLYDLLYRGQTLISNSPYPVCNGKKSELLKTGNYQARLFEIKLRV